MNETCIKHTLNKPNIGGCPYCEINRLKEELKVVRFDNNILRDQISAEAQVEHKRYEEWRDTLPADTAMPVASWHILKSTWMKSFLPAIKRAEDLERQLAKARAEVERFKYMAQQNSTEMCEWMEKYNKLVVPIECYNQMLNDEIMEHKQELTKARQEAVREVLEWAAGPESYDEWVAMVKERFGLEG